MKRSPAWDVTTELQTMRYQYTPFRIAKIQNTGNTYCGEDMEQENLVSLWWDGKTIHPLLEDRVSYKGKPNLHYTIQQLHFLVLTLLIWKLMFTQNPAWNIAILFLVLNTRKQPRCPLIDDWINKLCTSIHWNIIHW